MSDNPLQHPFLHRPDFSFQSQVASILQGLDLTHLGYSEFPVTTTANDGSPP